MVSGDMGAKDAIIKVVSLDLNPVFYVVRKWAPTLSKGDKITFREAYVSPHGTFELTKREGFVDHLNGSDLCVRISNEPGAHVWTHTCAIISINDEEIPVE
jgi:hypothetical protein